MNIELKPIVDANGNRAEGVENIFVVNGNERRMVGQASTDRPRKVSLIRDVSEAELAAIEKACETERVVSLPKALLQDD